MTGTCVNTIKVIGLGSVGLLSGSLAYQSIQTIPKLIDELNHQVTNKNWQMIKWGKVFNKIFLGFATSCFMLSYKYSPADERHPYLIYAILGTCLSYGYTYFKAYKYEKILNKFEKVKPTGKGKTEPVAAATQTSEPIKKQPVSTSESVPESDQQDDELGKSYIHVSDEDSTSAVSTPSQSSPGSPRVNDESSSSATAATTTTTTAEPAFKPEEEEDIEAEISLALFKKEMVNHLIDVKSIYLIGSGCFGLTFLISSIGVIGEFIMG